MTLGHLNIEKLTALFVVMPIYYLIYGFVKRDTNILKMHMCANIKKNCIISYVSLALNF